jgi:hypothetical protein
VVPGAQRGLSVDYSSQVLLSLHLRAALFLAITRYQLLYEGWRGYLIAWFALVWMANVYMSFFNRLRLDIKHENVSIAVEQKHVGNEGSGSPAKL